MGRTLPCRALERCVPRCRWELQGPDRCVEGQAGPGVCGHKGGEWGLRGSEVGTGRASSEAFRGPPHLVWGDSEGTNGRDQSGGPHVIQGFAPEVDAQRGGRAEAGGCPRVHWACPLLPRGHWPRHPRDPDTGFGRCRSQLGLRGSGLIFRKVVQSQRSPPRSRPELPLSSWV